MAMSLTGAPPAGAAGANPRRRARQFTKSNFWAVARHPLTPSLSPTGEEGGRRPGEGVRLGNTDIISGNCCSKERVRRILSRSERAYLVPDAGEPALGLIVGDGALGSELDGGVRDIEAHKRVVGGDVVRADRAAHDGVLFLTGEGG